MPSNLLTLMLSECCGHMPKDSSYLSLQESFEPPALIPGNAGNKLLAELANVRSILRLCPFKLDFNGRLAAKPSNHKSTSAVDLGWAKERSKEVGGMGPSFRTYRSRPESHSLSSSSPRKPTDEWMLDPIACICADDAGNSDSDAVGTGLVRTCLAKPSSPLTSTSALSRSSAGRSIFRLFAAISSNHRSTSASDLGWAKERSKEVGSLGASFGKD
mmetsp:Transcript_88147/g.284596  ORF Transcript_88147/g.284596 Transcript_88147/m.284596 type:complete len:216 (+) Transcript_88147:590-1237(+)